LPERRTLWLFGDSYLGATQASQRVYIETRFGNTIAVQADPADGEMPTEAENGLHFDWASPEVGGWLPIFDGTLTDPAVPASLDAARAIGTVAVSWPLHGTVIENDLILFNAAVTTVPCEGCGKFGFKVHGSTASIVRGVDRPYAEWGFEEHVGWSEADRPTQRFVPHGSAAPSLLEHNGVLWGTFVNADPEEPDTLYVYGHRRTESSNDLVVARITNVLTADDVLAFEHWDLYDGATWSDDPASAATILPDSAVEISIVAVPDPTDGASWVAVHSGVDMFAGRIHVAAAEYPWGPFTDRYVLALADCPVGNFDSTRPPVAYAAKAHPHFTTEDDLLISVILSPFTEDDGKLVPTDRYVPRFLRLPWNEVFDHPESSPERCVQ
jgi:hypothetical protein